jgi:outer membrane protein
VKSRIFGVLLSALFVVSMVSVSFAADKDFDRYGVRIRGIYVMPEEHFDGKLSSLNPVVDNAVAPELDLEYFFTKHISAELVLALVKHDIAINGGHNVVGSTWLLPPSLLVKYHFMPDSCKIDPYVGFGMNVVMPFDEHLTIGDAVNSLKIDTTVGWAAQIGADIPITQKCFLNVDVKYYNVNTQMRLNGASTQYNLELNPVIIGTGIGVRF